MNANPHSNTFNGLMYYWLVSDGHSGKVWCFGGIFI